MPFPRFELFLMGAVWAVMPGLAFSQEASVEVVIEGLRSDQGRVIVSVYTSEETFLESERSEFRVTSEIPPGTRQVLLRLNAPDGPFALGLLHDEDGDGEMDTNFIGMPKEGMGASNNPKSRFGPPDWEDAVVQQVQKGDRLVIQANYLF